MLIFIGTMSNLAAIYKYTVPLACIENKILEKISAESNGNEIYFAISTNVAVRSQIFKENLCNQTFQQERHFSCRKRKYLLVLRQTLVRPVPDAAYP